MDDVLSYFAGRKGYEEPTKVTIYDVWVHGQQVRLEVMDRGEAEGRSRFSVTAFSVDVAEAEREVKETQSQRSKMPSPWCTGTYLSSRVDSSPPALATTLT